MGTSHMSPDHVLSPVPLRAALLHALKRSPLRLYCLFLRQSLLPDMCVGLKMLLQLAFPVQTDPVEVAVVLATPNSGLILPYVILPYDRRQLRWWQPLSRHTNNLDELDFGNALPEVGRVRYLCFLCEGIVLVAGGGLGESTQLHTR